jgi:prevent-host-death family protein
MDSIGIADLKQGISAIINRVAFGGERIVLTSRGKPKAALVTMEDLDVLESLGTPAHPPSRTERSAALTMAQTIREMTLARRGGVPFSDVGDDLHRLREERDREVAGLR